MGKTIFREGYTPNRTMYFVLKGRVAIVVSNKNTEQFLQGGSDDLQHHEKIRIEQILQLKKLLTGMNLNPTMKQYLKEQVQAKIATELSEIFFG